MLQFKASGLGLGCCGFIRSTWPPDALFHGLDNSCRACLHNCLLKGLLRRCLILVPLFVGHGAANSFGVCLSQNMQYRLHLCVAALASHKSSVTDQAHEPAAAAAQRKGDQECCDRPNCSQPEIGSTCGLSSDACWRKTANNKSSKVPRPNVNWQEESPCTSEHEPKIRGNVEQHCLQIVLAGSG